MSPHFTDEERTALALTEAVTRLADRPDPVPGEVWDEAAGELCPMPARRTHQQIAAIDTWNRFNPTVKVVAANPGGKSRRAFARHRRLR